MAIIYSYPLKGTPNDNDLIVISDSEATDPKLRTKQVTVASIKGATASGVSQIVAGTNITISPVTGTGIVTINSSGGGGGTPGGSDTQMQYNNSGSFGGTTGLTWDDSTNILSIATRYEGDIDGAVLQQVLVKESGGVSKGDVVYISGGTGDNPEVMKAQANSVSTMAALGIMKENVALDAIGECVTSGEITGLNLTGFTTGDELFVSNTTAGELLASAPTGEANLVQKIGKVIKGGTGGALTVLGAFRTNATPNLNQGSLFIGNGSNQASTLAIGTNTHVLTSNGTTASWQAIPASGVTSFTNAFGTYITGTANTSATGAVTIGTIDLNAVDGTAIASTRFLSKDNTWDIPAYTTYNAASSSNLGLMKLASDTEQTVAAEPVTSESARTYGIQFNADDQAVVNVPWTNTTYTASGGVLLTGTNFTNSDRGSSQNIFKTVAVSGQADIVADSNADTLTFAAGAGVTLTTNNLTDTLTIAASSSSGALSLLKTSVFGYTGTNQASYSEFALTNSTTFAAVRFNPTNPLITPTNDVVVAITVPSTPANYIRVKTQFAVRSNSTAQEFVHCAWHHAAGSVTNPTYGWQTIGLDDDTTNDITVINYTTDLLVSQLVDLAGESASAGSTVYLWLKANCSATGTDILLGRWWPSTMSSTSTASAGPLVVEVYELVAGNRTFNPPTPE
jgi:hypothetical protein